VVVVHGSFPMGLTRVLPASGEDAKGPVRSNLVPQRPAHSGLEIAC
jgi:hypothetical protein